MASQTHPQTRKSRETAHDGGSSMEHTASELLHETINEFKERTDDIKTVVSEYVKEKPFKALGITLAAGVVLALFLKR